MNLRLVYDAETPAEPPRSEPRSLDSMDQLEPTLRELLDAGFDGEVVLRGHGRARICLYRGTIAWVRLEGYPEHLGDVLRRELGLNEVALRRGIAHCRNTGQRFGEGMVALGLLRPQELRQALLLHIGDQLVELMTWPGPLTVENSGWPHRYDTAFTFSLDEVLRRPSLPTPAEQRWLDAITAACCERLPELQVVCVAETEEGTVLCSRTGADPTAEDLMGLCLAGLHRLVDNRITRNDGSPQGLVLRGPHGCLLARPLAGRPRWLLLLGGPVHAGRLLSVASAAIASADEPTHQEQPSGHPAG